MTAAAHMLIGRGEDAFCHDAAQRLRHTVVNGRCPAITIDFQRVERITTAALAELVLFRRKLLREGCELRVTNMSGQVADLYRLCRLDGALPMLA
jgi:anti-anti-sigma regulatory factor